MSLLVLLSRISRKGYLSLVEVFRSQAKKENTMVIKKRLSSMHLFLLFFFFFNAIGCNEDEYICEEFGWGEPIVYDQELTPFEGTVIYTGENEICEMTDFDTSTNRVLYNIIDSQLPWPVVSNNKTKVGINDTRNGVIGTFEFNIEDGSDIKLLLTPEGDLSEGIINWHPEHGYICVIKNIDNNDEIYTMSDSTTLKNLTNHMAWDDFPVADSQGSIYFFSLRKEEKEEEKGFVTIYKIDKNGSNLEKIMDLEEHKSQDFGCLHNGNFPTISPNDRYLVFNQFRDLFCLDLITNELINLTNTVDLYEAFAFFHPSDSERVFFSLRAGDGSGFCSIKIDGTEAQRHTWGNHRYGKFID